ncbi:MAG: hypothetical protein MUD01_13165 [Chloroflexaceae bacterium]|jgi:hypothetical protein|nr:hypothetical protein [Chloroflexaceae bacterium]
MARSFRFVALLALLLAVLAGCGGASAVTLNDIPVFENAQLLEPGKNPIADTLAKNVQQAGQMGAKLDQRMYTLPKDTSWDSVQAFYKEKLEGSGWKSLNMPAAGSDMAQLSIWTRGTQSLTVARIAEPVNNELYLLFSLSSQ